MTKAHFSSKHSTSHTVYLRLNRYALRIFTIYSHSIRNTFERNRWCSVWLDWVKFIFVVACLLLEFQRHGNVSIFCLSLFLTLHSSIVPIILFSTSTCAGCANTVAVIAKTLLLFTHPIPLAIRRQVCLFFASNSILLLSWMIVSKASPLRKPCFLPLYLWCSASRVTHRVSKSNRMYINTHSYSSYDAMRETDR